MRTRDEELLVVIVVIKDYRVWMCKVDDYHCINLY